MVIDVQHWELNVCECGHGKVDHEHPDFLECEGCYIDDPFAEDPCIDFRPRTREAAC